MAWALGRGASLREGQGRGVRRVVQNTERVRRRLLRDMCARALIPFAATYEGYAQRNGPES